ncbi:MAG: UbiX family flavin prenyltransferase [Acidobacteria bacterium]|nr:UbiX family flavin prenyltransferase [Acidobacteriota bacterium]
MNAKKIIVALTGATGTILGIRLLQALQRSAAETHLVVSRWAGRTLLHETPYTLPQVQSLAAYSYSPDDIAAPISSGSFLTHGMVIIPCSMRTLAAIAHGHGDNLIHRAADVILKERRKLALIVREAPLSDIHLENMLKLSRLGAVIFPPVPAFYNHPCTIDDIVDHIVMRVLDQFDIHLDGVKRWDGIMSTGGKLPE